MTSCVSTKSLALLGVALGMMLTLTPTPAAAVPGPLCGPTILWSCVVPGCPDCPVVLFGGTVCEKIAFEKKTGRVCTAGD